MVGRCGCLRERDVFIIPPLHVIIVTVPFSNLLVHLFLERPFVGEGAI